MSRIFTGNYIRLSDKAYPRTGADIRLEHSHVSFPKDLTPEVAEAFGHAAVYETLRPTADGVLIEGPPEQREGAYFQTWEVREYSEMELAERLQTRRNALLVRVDQLVDRALELGKPYTFPNGMLEHVQLRERDQARLLILLADAQQRLSSGAEEPLQFRTAENNVHVLSAAEMAALVNAGFAYVMEVAAKGWHLKDAITSARTLSELPELPASITLI